MRPSTVRRWIRSRHSITVPGRSSRRLQSSGLSSWNQSSSAHSWPWNIMGTPRAANIATAPSALRRNACTDAGSSWSISAGTRVLPFATSSWLSVYTTRSAASSPPAMAAASVCTSRSSSVRAVSAARTGCTKPAAHWRSNPRPPSAVGAHTAGSSRRSSAIITAYGNSLCIVSFNCCRNERPSGRSRDASPDPSMLRMLIVESRRRPSTPYSANHIRALPIRWSRTSRRP